MSDAAEKPSTIQQIRREHNITSRAVAEAAGVEFQSEYLLEIGAPVERGTAIKILQALSELTGGDYTLDNVAGLSIITISIVKEHIDTLTRVEKER